jgi:hypothetical protein
MPNPPFGSAEYVLRTPPELKQGYKLLEAFSSFPLYSNAATALESIFRRCQRRSVVFPDNEQGVFPPPNRLRQKNQEYSICFAIGKQFHTISG